MTPAEMADKLEQLAEMVHAGGRLSQDDDEPTLIAAAAMLRRQPTKHAALVAVVREYQDAYRAVGKKMIHTVRMADAEDALLAYPLPEPPK